MQEPRIKREKEEPAEDSDGNNSRSCCSGSNCCRKCCEVSSHWLVSDSSDESEYSCYNYIPGDCPDPEPNATEGGSDEYVTIDQIGETVEIEDEDDDEIEIVLDFIDLTYANNNPQIQYHPAPTPTPPPQCPCRSPPGPLATSTPNKKRKLE